MPGLTHLHSSFGDDPKKWSQALHKSTLIPKGLGKIMVAIPLPNGIITRVSTDQLEIIAEKFQKKGSSEMGIALSALKNRAYQQSEDDLEPVPLAAFRKPKKITEKKISRSSSTSHSKSSTKRAPSSSDTFGDSEEVRRHSQASLENIENEPEEALRTLFKEIFPHDTLQDFIELERYSLKNQIISITKGAKNIDHLRKAVQVFDALIAAKKPSWRKRKAIQEALQELKAKVAAAES